MRATRAAPQGRGAAAVTTTGLTYATQGPAGPESEWAARTRTSPYAVRPSLYLDWINRPKTCKAATSAAPLPSLASHTGLLESAAVVAAERSLPDTRLSVEPATLLRGELLALLRDLAAG